MEPNKRRAADMLLTNHKYRPKREEVMGRPGVKAGARFSVS